MNNIKYLKYKASFDNLLCDYIDSCNKFNIKLYIIENNISIFRQQYIIDQIINEKQKIINNHITNLSNFLNINYNKYNYLYFNNNFINENINLLILLDDLLDKTNLIFEYKLLDNDYVTSMPEYLNFIKNNNILQNINHQFRRQTIRYENNTANNWENNWGFIRQAMIENVRSH